MGLYYIVLISLKLKSIDLIAVFSFMNLHSLRIDYGLKFTFISTSVFINEILFRLSKRQSRSWVLILHYIIFNSVKFVGNDFDNIFSR